MTSFFLQISIFPLNLKSEIIETNTNLLDHVHLDTTLIIKSINFPFSLSLSLVLLQRTFFSKLFIYFVVQIFFLIYLF